VPPAQVHLDCHWSRVTSRVCTTSWAADTALHCSSWQQHPEARCRRKVLQAAAVLRLYASQWPHVVRWVQVWLRSRGERFAPRSADAYSARLRACRGSHPKASGLWVPLDGYCNFAPRATAASVKLCRRHVWPPCPGHPTSTLHVCQTRLTAALVLVSLSWSENPTRQYVLYMLQKNGH